MEKTENQVVGLRDGIISSISIEKSINTKKPVDLSLLKLAETLSI